MKKRFLVLAGIVGLTVSLLAACGNGTSNMDTQKEDSFQQNEIVQNKTETQEEIIEESEQTSETESEALLPEDRAWIDEVYNDLLAGNKEDIIALLTSKDLVEKVAPYIKESWAMWDYEEAYGLVTTDGKVVGVVLYENESYIFYSENNDGFEALYQGDYMFSYNKKDGSYSWLDGDTLRYSDGRTFSLSPEEIVMVWHM